MILQAGDSRSPESAAAMERLCVTYWYPLYSFVRRKGYGHEDACDLTQGFFVHFLERDCLASVDAARGKFRTFMLTSLGHFLANEWDRARAQKRGGGFQFLSLDAADAEERYRMEPVDEATPDRLFERGWAQAVMQVVLDRLAAEIGAARFEVLKPFLLAEKGAVSYDASASALGVSVPAVTSAIHRMRSRFRVLLFDEIANTVGSPDAVEDEVRHLLGALGD